MRVRGQLLHSIATLQRGFLAAFDGFPYPLEQCAGRPGLFQARVRSARRNECLRLILIEGAGDENAGASGKPVPHLGEQVGASAVRSHAQIGDYRSKAIENSLYFENYGELAMLYFEMAWRDGQKQLATLAAGISAVVAFVFLLRAL